LGNWGVLNEIEQKLNSSDSYLQWETGIKQMENASKKLCAYF